MKLWCLTDNSFICFGRNTEALRYSYPIKSGQFSQVRAFPPNNHEFCCVNILKTKHKGTHTFPSFNRTDFSLTARTSLHLSSLDDSFLSRRGSALRLLTARSPASVRPLSKSTPKHPPPRASSDRTGMLMPLGLNQDSNARGVIQARNTRSREAVNVRRSTRVVSL